ncbi:hypothetical protein [Albidovulum sp.]|jgi:hypothetical protein
MNRINEQSRAIDAVPERFRDDPAGPAHHFRDVLHLVGCNTGPVAAQVAP